MRFGTCVGFDKLESAAKLGYDYLESNLGHIKSLSEQELKNTKAINVNGRVISTLKTTVISLTIKLFISYCYATLI